MNTCQITLVVAAAHLVVMRGDSPAPIIASELGAYQEAQIGDVIITSSGGDIMGSSITDLDLPLTTGVRLSEDRLDILLNKLQNWPNAFQFLANA